jgi:hypothetical protein
MDLLQASRQWATRPDDQRFTNLMDMLKAAVIARKQAVIGSVPMNQLKIEPKGQELVLVGNNSEATMNHWAFGQLCTRIGAPASYLRKLPAELACENLGYGLEHCPDTSIAKILIASNGCMTAKAILSQDYTRIWNFDLIDRLMQLPPEWRVPPARPCRAGMAGARPATEADVLQDQGHGLSIKLGDMIAPAGLYASDEDMFVFMVNEGRRINDGSEDGVSRGFFLSNSEVGKAALKLTTFYYKHVCGNHIVWNATGVKELKIRHVGMADSRFNRELQIELTKYSDASVSDEEAKILHARQFTLAADKDKLIDLIFQKGILSRTRAEEAYKTAETCNYIESPKTAWGFAQGITQLSQTLPNADARVELDKAAGKVIELAF